MRYKCKKCGKGFSSATALGGHGNAHSAPEMKAAKAAAKNSGAQEYRRQEYAANQAAYAKNPTLCKRKQCDKPLPYPYNANPRIFCSQSCSATYNNTHKSYGIRRSKLEKYVEENLLKDFPDVTFTFNAVGVINFELDIYIPSLRLAIELNGPVHYEPIYGTEKFEKIQNNDAQKFKLCYEAGIELAVINVIKHKPTQASYNEYYGYIKDLVIKNLPRQS